MDQHKEKEEEEEEDQFHESSDRKEEAEEEDSAEESTDHQREGHKEGRTSEESTGLQQLKEVVDEGVGSEEGSPLVGVFAHPCSLLQYLLRACAGCCGLHGGAFSDPKPPAVAPDDEVAPSNSSQDCGEGEKANYFYIQAEVVTRVRAVRRRPQPPGRPREGNGGNGGIHH